MEAKKRRLTKSTLEGAAEKIDSKSLEPAALGSAATNVDVPVEGAAERIYSQSLEPAALGSAATNIDVPVEDAAEKIDSQSLENAALGSAATNVDVPGPAGHGSPEQNTGILSSLEGTAIHGSTDHDTAKGDLKEPGANVTAAKEEKMWDDASDLDLSAALDDSIIAGQGSSFLPSGMTDSPGPPSADRRIINRAKRTVTPVKPFVSTPVTPTRLRRIHKNETLALLKKIRSKIVDSQERQTVYMNSAILATGLYLKNSSGRSDLDRVTKVAKEDFGALLSLVQQATNSVNKIK